MPTSPQKNALLTLSLFAATACLGWYLIAPIFRSQPTEADSSRSLGVSPESQQTGSLGVSPESESPRNLVFSTESESPGSSEVSPESPATKKPQKPTRQLEKLDRALVALDQKDKVYLTWRMLGDDPADIAFNLYRNGQKINAEPIADSTNYLDAGGSVKDEYSLGTLLADGSEKKSPVTAVWPRKAATRAERKKAVPWLEIPLDPPSEQHVPGDMSVGDLDGDGRYELVFEWEGPQPYLEAVNLDGQSLWRIACGPNVDKAKTAILVYDLNGDGRAEVACKTGPGTKDGTGKFLSHGPAADDDDSALLDRATYKSRPTHLLEEVYITVFDGATGRELTTAFYEPLIGPRDEMKENWDDSHGYRANSIKAAVLHHAEHGPLLVFCRGIYSRISACAFRWTGDSLEKVWTFDTKGHPEYEGYRGQGNHSVAVGDVDGDGSDELIYGACAIDHDGTGLYTTGRGHGDSHALGDLMPDRPGLEFYQGHENSTYGISMRDAGTGEIIWEKLSEGDVGRAWAADVDPAHRGAECTSTATKNLDCHGKEIGERYNPYSQLIYFDGDVQRDLRGGIAIDDGSGPHGRILTGWYYGADTIHHTKKDANLVADLIGDWREEVVFRRFDNKALIIFTTWIPTGRKNPTLMHDPLYRMNIAVQSIGYNQPAHTSYNFADGPPAPIK
ncbi:MAG: rhamnogalacturonan lyase [Verrucomicrobiales bacterium]